MKFVRRGSGSSVKRRRASLRKLNRRDQPFDAAAFDVAVSMNEAYGEHDFLIGF